MRRRFLTLNVCTNRRLAGNPLAVVLDRTSRTHSHKPLNLLAVPFMEHIGLKNNENRIKKFQRGAECALDAEELKG